MTPAPIRCKPSSSMSRLSRLRQRASGLFSGCIACIRASARRSVALIAPIRHAWVRLITGLFREKHDFTTHRIALTGMSRLSAFRRQALTFLTWCFVPIRHAWVRLIIGLYVVMLATWCTYTGYKKWQQTTNETNICSFFRAILKTIFGIYNLS